ncbi:hypothetical protein NIES22_61440 [Calothrix brevissima NIES-22]|nr:hypothetical protein NIES22_61440 [Calothrix brevissima NIES-22]
MQWFKIWLFTPALVLMGFTLNETLLRKGAYQPSIVSDADLFCDVYSQIKALGKNDVILLGASRMQTGFDLNILHQHFPHKKAILLAQSGRGTSYPVFKDIVENTNFRGVIILDETEQTLISPTYDQKEFIEYCHTNYSLNRQLNHQISAWLQNNFVFLNPGGSSLRLWGNLLIQHQLPEPYYTKTLFDREELIDYKRADKQFLHKIHDDRLNGVKQAAKQSFPNPNTWLQQTEHWQTLVENFQERGGHVIFIRMPTSQERWAIENQIAPPEQYWKQFVDKLHVASVHFADYPELSNFKLPDTSHIDMRDKPVFTEILLNKMDNSLND